MALRRLVVEDFELIASAELEPSSRLTAITGETGSGKTMLLDAIDFVLGARTSADSVRKGQKRARVAVEFDIDARVQRLLREQGLETDDDTLVIVRELSDGKTSARLGGLPVAATQLREIGRELAEIVGQHEAQRLLVPGQQLDALDRFGGEKHLALCALVEETHRRHAEANAELQAFEAAASRSAAELEYARFAVREISDVAPESGEDEQLRERRELLANAERVAESLRSAHAALADAESNATDLLGTAAAALESLSRFGEEWRTLAGEAGALQSESVELAARVARRMEEVGVDSGELDRVTERLEALDRVKKKYGGTIEAALAQKRELETIVDRFEHSGDHRVRLTRARDQAATELAEAAGALTAARKRAAKACEKRVQEELTALAMPAARFQIAFEPLAETGPHGAERCEFRLAANPGEPARALARSTSGGELSRVMLALTVVLADRAAHTTLIFDEIDAGVGGATANAVGARLADLAKDLQVICVTHLAQVAAFANEQVSLRKRDARGTTLIELARLDDEARLQEVARMLSGATTGVSLEHARTLLRERALSS